jgi:hypothetical protein
MRQQSVGLRRSGGARCRRRAGGDRLAPGVLIRFVVAMGWGESSGIRPLTPAPITAARSSSPSSRWRREVRPLFDFRTASSGVAMKIEE